MVDDSLHHIIIAFIVFSFSWYTFQGINSSLALHICSFLSNDSLNTLLIRFFPFFNTILLFSIKFLKNAIGDAIPRYQ